MCHCRIAVQPSENKSVRRLVGPRGSAPEPPPPRLMGERPSAAGMRVSSYTKAIFTVIPMEVGVVVPSIVCCDFLAHHLGDLL